MATKPTARANARQGPQVTPSGQPVDVWYLDGKEAKRQNAQPPHVAVGAPRVISGWYYETSDADVFGPYTSSNRAYAAACGKPEGWDARPNHHSRQHKETSL